MCSYLQAVKCGYCGWIIFGSCGDIVSHDCFKNYDECIHVLVVDEKGRASESNESTSYSADIMDEMLIDAVEQRPGLWNQKLPVQRRSPCSFFTASIGNL